MTMRIYLVDDEPLALARLERLLRADSRVEIVGSSCNAEQAAAEIARLAPELCFLDIEMPRMNGFEMLARLERQPTIIFVTAYEQYALRAFGVNSVDYLLKPVEPTALTRALDKVERLRGSGAATPAIDELLRRLREQTPTPANAYPERIASRAGERLRFLDLAEVSHFYAEDKLVYAVKDGRAYSVDHTLGELELRLDPRKFVRIHRAAMVNLAWVKEASPMPGGSLNLRLKDARATELTTSRDRAKEFKERMGG